MPSRHMIPQIVIKMYFKRRCPRILRVLLSNGTLRVISHKIAKWINRHAVGARDIQLALPSLKRSY